MQFFKKYIFFLQIINLWTEKIPDRLIDNEKNH